MILSTGNELLKKWGSYLICRIRICDLRILTACLLVREISECKEREILSVNRSAAVEVNSYKV